MHIDDDDLTPLVDGIHNIVVAPDRLEALLDIWSKRLHHGSVSAAGFNLLDEPEISAHIEQAGFELRNVIESADAARPAVIAWVNSVRNATVAVTRTGYVVAANDAAAKILDLTAGTSIDALGLDEEDHRILLAEISSVKAPYNGAARLLRLRRPKPAGLIVLRLVEAVGGDPYVVGLITTIVSWPERLTGLVQNVFNLTGAEADVLRELALGQSVKEISAATDRSEPTIRSHVSALLDKTETRSQIELIRMTLGLLEAVEPKPGEPFQPPFSLASRPVHAFSTLILEDHRRLDYLVIGHPRGAPFLLMPGGVGTSPFPSRDEQTLYQRRLRMVVPVRAGFGGSSPLPRDRHVHEVAASDTFALMDHLGIARMPFVTVCDDFRIAIELASIAPERMAAIIGCGAPMPAVTHEHYARMSKWSRFVSANARYAPRALPYVALTFFSLVRRLGPKRFMQTVMADSPADLRVIEDDEVMAAIARSSEVAVSPNFTAHVAWAAEAAASLSADWSDKLRACNVPITLFAGHQDPFSPFETVKDYAAALPHIRLNDYPDCGQLLHPYVSTLFDVIEETMRMETDVLQPRLL